jgi:hypothetical protein
MRNQKCLLRVVWVGKEAAVVEAESLAKALASTARKLDIDLDVGPPAAGSPDGLLVVALNGNKDGAMAEVVKRVVSVGLCVGGVLVVLCPSAS